MWPPVRQPRRESGPTRVSYGGNATSPKKSQEKEKLTEEGRQVRHGIQEALGVHGAVGGQRVELVLQQDRHVATAEGEDEVPRRTQPSTEREPGTALLLLLLLGCFPPPPTDRQPASRVCPLGGGGAPSGGLGLFSPTGEEFTRRHHSKLCCPRVQCGFVRRERAKANYGAHVARS